jgi:hypothetical protein
MIARSTGLGKSKILANLSDLKTDGDLLILYLDTTEPEGWHLRAAMQVQDIPDLIKGFMKPSIILFIIRSLLFPKKNPKEPEEF